MANFNTSRSAILIFVLWLISHSSLCFALDNPDAPDFVSEFKARCEKFEILIYKQVQNEREAILAYGQYKQFLNQEINQACLGLTKRMGGAPRQNIVQSQRRWLQYRNAEFIFIDSNWMVENFGTSSAFSRGTYRTAIIKDRVVELLHYLKNY
jgi:uncharacterized protein YecT (DUF1311 family)